MFSFDFLLLTKPHQITSLSNCASPGCEEEKNRQSLMEKVRRVFSKVSLSSSAAPNYEAVHFSSLAVVCEFAGLLLFEIYPDGFKGVKPDPGATRFQNRAVTYNAAWKGLGLLKRWCWKQRCFLICLKLWIVYILLLFPALLFIIN